MKILLLGGTSFFGKDIASRLTEAGHHVATFSTRKERPAGLPPGVHYSGDRTDSAALQTVGKAEKWDVLIDNIAFTADQIAAALTSFPSIKRYIFTSSVSVYRYSRMRFRQPIVEDCVDFDYTPPEENLQDRHWAYARGKFEAERLLMNQQQVPWTITRPPVVYGPEDPSDRGFWYLSRLFDGEPLLLASGGIQSFRLASRTDTAKIYLPIVEERVAEGKVYNLAQREVITLKDFIDSGAEVLGQVPNYLEAPLSRIGETLGGPWAPMANFIPDYTRAERELGFTPTPWETTCTEAARWYEANRSVIDKKVLVDRPKEIAFARSWRAALANT